MDAHEWLTSFEERSAEVGRRAERAATALAAVTAAATSPDGSVTVTVTPSGALHGLVLGPPSEQLTRTRLAELVLVTARHAQSAAAQQAVEAVAPLLGADSEALRVLRSTIMADAGPGGRR